MVVIDADPHPLLQAGTVLRDVHVVVPIGFHLGVLLAPDLPVDGAGLTVPSLREQLLLLVLTLVNQTDEDSAIGADVLDGNIYEELDVRVRLVQRQFAVDYAVLFANVPLPNPPQVLVYLKT